MVLRLALVLAAAAVLVTGAYAVGTWRAEAGLEERRALVAERGAEVMPFDLEQTTHLFAPRRDGGVQSVTADDPGDAVQTARIREHLREEAAAFRRGEFDDPAAIHGTAMPGLAELRAGREPVSKRSPVPPGRPGRRDSSSSVAPVASDYEHSLRPSLALAHGAPAARLHSETSSTPGSRSRAGTFPPAGAFATRRQIPSSLPPCTPGSTPSCGDHGEHATRG